MISLSYNTVLKLCIISVSPFSTINFLFPTHPHAPLLHWYTVRTRSHWTMKLKICNKLRKCGEKRGGKKQKRQTKSNIHPQEEISFSTVSAKLTRFIRRTLGISSIFGESLLKKRKIRNYNVLNLLPYQLDLDFYRVFFSVFNLLIYMQLWHCFFSLPLFWKKKNFLLFFYQRHSILIRKKLEFNKNVSPTILPELL